MFIQFIVLGRLLEVVVLHAHQAALVYVVLAHVDNLHGEVVFESVHFEHFSAVVEVAYVVASVLLGEFYCDENPDPRLDQVSQDQERKK